MKTFETKEELRDWARYIVPEDAKWIVVDQENFLFAYATYPTVINNNWSTIDKRYLLNRVSISFPWQDSLIEIEHPIDLTKYIGKVVRFVNKASGAYYYDVYDGTDDIRFEVTPLKHEDIEP